MAEIDGELTLERHGPVDPVLDAVEGPDQLQRLIAQRRLIGEVYASPG